MKSKKILVAILCCVAGITAYAQGLANLKITEVVVENTDGLVDEYGTHTAWIEIGNTSWSSTNVSGCFLTCDPSVLDPNLSAPQRIARMSQIPRGDERTNLSPKGHLVFFADGRTNLGTLHTNFTLTPGQEIFVALYEANGTVLIDSVRVPATLPANNSWSRFDQQKWLPCTLDKVTPNSANDNTVAKADKIAEFKEKDPHGFAMTILGMGIVLSGLLILSILFTLFGNIMHRVNSKKDNAQPQPSPKPAKKADAATEIAVASLALHQALADDDAVKAVIAMALYEYEHDAHDEESGIITIIPQASPWPQRSQAMNNRFSK